MDGKSRLGDLVPRLSELRTAHALLCMSEQSGDHLSELQEKRREKAAPEPSNDTSTSIAFVAEVGRLVRRGRARRGITRRQLAAEFRDFGALSGADRRRLRQSFADRSEGDRRCAGKRRSPPSSRMTTARAAEPHRRSRQSPLAERNGPSLEQSIEARVVRRRAIRTRASHRACRLARRRQVDARHACSRSGSAIPSSNSIAWWSRNTAPASRC